jgi:hypothetical protein
MDFYLGQLQIIARMRAKKLPAATRNVSLEWCRIFLNVDEMNTIPFTLPLSTPPPPGPPPFINFFALPWTVILFYMFNTVLEFIKTTDKIRVI